MNDKVREMVERLFDGAADNEETRALRDELMDNCLEHYQDLVSGGMDEQAALEAVKDSLSGMQEIVDRYSGKPDRAVIPVPQAEKPAEEEPAGIRTEWPAEGIEGLRIDAAGHSVEVSGSDEDVIRVTCDTPKAVRVEKDGPVLFIEAVRISDEAFGAVREAGDPSGEGEETKAFLDMSLNEILKKARQVVGSVVKVVEQHVKDGTLFDDAVIRISVPRHLLRTLEAGAASGDISVEGLSVPDTAVRTASGDIRVDIPADETAEKMFLSSASGDITLFGTAKEAQISAISGDLMIKGSFDSLKSKSVSGDVDMEGAAGDLKTKSVSGDVTIRLLRADAGSLGTETTSGDVTLVLPQRSAALSLSVSTVAGDVINEVEVTGGDAPLKMSVRTVSGDIHVCRGEM